MNSNKIEICRILQEAYICPICGNDLYLLNNMRGNKIKYKSILNDTIDSADVYQNIKNGEYNRLVCDICNISYFIDYRWFYPYPIRLKDIKREMIIS